MENVLAEDYTLDDVRLHMERSDLRRIGLRGGVELRLWRSIIRWRELNDKSAHESEDGNHTNDPPQMSLRSTNL
ncbi:hypothetical protein J437_LFUL002896 [Ladona fulva]|uniref:SAM domain-containing protein n=1 Tax=Ladona fulva TaxID=123851 RepID=A0A8K0KQ91_LADFU|nr:hypothetical protein J437_LFUL002896 [Ladona fulva]